MSSLSQPSSEHIRPVFSEWAPLIPITSDRVEFKGSFDIFQIIKIIILFQFYTNFKKTMANNSQRLLCKMTDSTVPPFYKQLPKIPVQSDWFHCSTILRCYPFTFLYKFMQRAERTVSPVTSAQQTPRPGIKETDRLFAICEATCAGVKGAAQAGTGRASLYF